MENEKVKKKGKLKWIILGVVVLVLAIFIITPSSSEPTVEELTGDGSSTETSQVATKNIKPGSVVTNDEVKINYKSSNTDFKKYSSYADVKKGYKVIEAVFDFENITSYDIVLDGFECYADGAKCERFYSVEDYTDPWYESLSAGRKLTDIKIYFEVPNNSESIELEYEADFWSSEKYIFIVE